MTVTLDVAPSGDVAVLHGVDSEAALAHLFRSLIMGSVFDTYSALVIDVGDAEPDAALAGDLHGAAEACLNRHQWLAIVHSSADVAGAVAQARQWRRLVDNDHAFGIPRYVSGLLSTLLRATGSVRDRLRFPKV